MPTRPIPTPPLPVIHVATPDRIHFESACRTKAMTIIAKGSAMRPMYEVSCSRRHDAQSGTCHSDTLTPTELRTLFWTPNGEQAIPRTEVCFQPLQPASSYILPIPEGVHEAVATMLNKPTT